MTFKERQKARNQAIKSSKSCYSGTCLRCKRKSIHIFVEYDLCFACEQEDLEFQEKKHKPPYDINDKEQAFKHEKLMQGWSDDKDEEIWDNYFRFE